VGNASDDRANVLRFWGAAELFSPPDIRKANPHEHVYDIANDGPLPWEQGHELRQVALPERNTWRHTVYGGIFPVGRVRDLLEREFGDGAEKFYTPPSGETALFALRVTDEGLPVRGSEDFASCAWAVGRLLRPGPQKPGWLTGFEQARGECQRAYARLITGLDGAVAGADHDIEASREAQPVGWDVLGEILGAAAERFGVVEALRPAGIRVVSFQVSARRDPAADSGELLNSLFAADLARVASAVSDGDCGAALEAYLRGPADTADRVDLRSRPAVVDEHVAPEYIPAGRWPSRKSQSLALSQQFAANTVMRELAGAPGIFGINGPPGTGKTTMLRELIAAIVVERARRLAGLAHPRDAFTEEISWRTDGRRVSVRKWDRQLTGFEIVVASYNNGAVENISLAIPGRDAIAVDEWLAEASYYPGLATVLLNSTNDGTKPELEAWGLVAGRLGRMDNRQKFVNAFWFGEPNDDVPRFKSILKDYERRTADWPAAVRSFRAALDEEAGLRAERVAVGRKLLQVPVVRTDIGRALARLRAAGLQADQASADLRRAEAGEANAQRAVDLAVQAQEAHGLLRPGRLAAWLGWSRSARTWRSQDRELAAGLVPAWRSLQAARDAVAGQAALREDARADLQSRSAQAADLATQLDRLESEIAAARARWGDAMPEPAEQADPARRELHGTWGDPEWNVARSRLFLAALRLHQEFLAAEPDRMRRNLDAAVDVIKGKVPGQLPAEAIQAAWQSLFFVVPVLSTTFASFAATFSRMGRESLGWLFIDEAGQAIPQSAVGAIWRAQRVIAVGDPMQLEPVVTLPTAAQQNLAASYGVSEWWLPGQTSAQQLADAANVYGTYLPAQGDDVWVGAPMRVHRRCADPMFTISNAIAYDGLMVFGTVSPADPLDVTESKWIDVPSDAPEGHWIPLEGARARWILTALTDRGGVDPERIFVLSPFRDVAHHIDIICREFPGVRGGTVHTAQGKEADIVVLILGSDPQKAGARKWASDRPNLLNVAVSRARQRLYVVGDRAAWMQCPYFEVLAELLPVRSPAGGGVS
jgi:hypothetical protein